MKIDLIQLWLPVPIDSDFTYRNNGVASVGDVVEVFFGTRKTKIAGICIARLELEEEECKEVIGIDANKIKSIVGVVQSNVFSLNLLEFLNKFKIHYLLERHHVLELVLVQQIFGSYNRLSNQVFTLTKKHKTLGEVGKIIIGAEAIGLLTVRKVANLVKSGELQSKELVVVKNHTTLCNAVCKIDNNLDLKQQACFDEILVNGLRGTTLLYGVTGSGKTEVYLAVADKVLAQDLQAQIMILLPEITMVSSLVGRFKKHFAYLNDADIAIWHSGVKEAEKEKYIYAITNGIAKVIIGARSAVMLPCKNLKLIIVDEEHDQSYKQDTVPAYNGRDVAVLRANIENFPVLLCSATPSIESFNNTTSGKYKLVKLSVRYNGNVMPIIKIIDTSGRARASVINGATSAKDGNVLQSAFVGGGKIFTKTAIDAILTAIKNEHQTLVFLNRRGYARKLACKGCGEFCQCPNCDNNLVYHKKNNMAKCHYCLHSITVPRVCKCCGKEFGHTSSGSYGLERVEEELKSLIPNARMVVMSSDTMNNSSETERIIEKIDHGEVDIILGTQISTKGYNFKKLKLVVALNVDIDSITGDVRIFERTYQLLMQVAGRAGRFDKLGGEFLIQTDNPDNPVVQSILLGQEDQFYFEEINRRKIWRLPPFCKQIAVIVSSKNKDEATEVINKVATIAAKVAPSGVQVLGPAENFVHKMQNYYRYHILLQGERYSQLHFIVNNYIKPAIKQRSTLLLKIDACPNGLI